MASPEVARLPAASELAMVAGVGRRGWRESVAAALAGFGDGGPRARLVVGGDVGRAGADPPSSPVAMVDLERASSLVAMLASAPERLTASAFPAMIEHVSYPGGKNGAGVCQRIVSLMPPHEVYVEPFLGGGAVMRLKRPARVNIGLDLDAGVIAEAARLAGIGGWLVSSSSAGTGDASWDFRCADAVAFLRARRFVGGELVYCDPPYLLSTRASSRRLYVHEMSDDQHRALLRVIRGLPCRVMISGYWSLMYERALRGWRSIEFEARTRGGTTATEWVWFNFEAPVELHDYRYLGGSFRERERIKRQQRRWSARLRRMPALERQALLAAMGGLGGAGG